MAIDSLILASLFAFGLIVGSFLNVVALRFNTGLSVAKGRSVCFSCGKTLRWYELVPVFSFLAQRGACRACGSKISWQYPIVELLGGLAFVAAYAATPGALDSAVPFFEFLLAAAVLCLYIVIAVYDARHKIIPDAFSYSAAALALCLVALSWSGAGDYYRVIAGPALFLFFWVFWAASRGRWMGLGDGKLALSIGWMLGLERGIAALLLSFWIGAIVSLAVMALQRLFGGRSGLRMRSEIPFGPFLLVGFLIAFLGHVDVQAILSYLAV